MPPVTKIPEYTPHKSFPLLGKLSYDIPREQRGLISFAAQNDIEDHGVAFIYTEDSIKVICDPSHPDFALASELLSKHLELPFVPNGEDYPIFTIDLINTNIENFYWDVCQKIVIDTMVAKEKGMTLKEYHDKVGIKYEKKIGRTFADRERLMQKLHGSD